MNYLNDEHYPDYTAWQAIINVEREFKPKGFRPIVFICSPYAGDVKANAANARSYCRFAVKMGYIPMAPHLLFPQFLHDKKLAERNLGMYMGLVMMSKCHEVWVFGDTITKGMSMEIAKAKYKGKKIRYFKAIMEADYDEA